jgi:hypothetical protein
VKIAKAGFLSIVPALSMLTSACGNAEPMNGFDVSGALIPAEEIHLGGPPRDGIPALVDPEFVASGKARIKPDDAVLGLRLQGVAKAYPIAIMNWHEIVNDEFGDTPVAVTYCPLCGTGVAYSARAAGRTLRFGVSGLLYNSDVLLYDRETESLWSQLLNKAVAGPLKSERLTPLPLVHTTWSEWHRGHPDTLVLSRNTGYWRDYDRDPYAGYETEEGLYFPVARKDPRYHPKERVLGVEVEGRFKAYPFAELSKTTGRVEDSIGDRDVLITFSPAHQTAIAYDPQGKQIPAVRSYWFAWYAFHPDTEVYQARDETPRSPSP